MIWVGPDDAPANDILQEFDAMPLPNSKEISRNSPGHWNPGKILVFYAWLLA